MSLDAGTERALLTVAFLAFFVACSCASTPTAGKPQPVATYDLSALLPEVHGGLYAGTVAFGSDDSIAVGLCRANCSMSRCSLSRFRWDNGRLSKVAETSKFESGSRVHFTPGDRVMTFGWSVPNVLYSSDLSTSDDISKTLWHVSQSGETVAEPSRYFWTLYRWDEGLTPIGKGFGDLVAVEDNLIARKDSGLLKVESLDGKGVGSFSMPSKGGVDFIGFLGDSRLYIDDCNTVRIVTFSGETRLRLNPHKGCTVFDTQSSADGRRIMFDFNDRKVPMVQHVLETFRSVTSFGMIGPEDVNGETVRVADTKTGDWCFSWHGGIPDTYDRPKSAAISASGNYVAIVNKEKLAIYGLPAVCDGSSARSSK